MSKKRFYYKKTLKCIQIFYIKFAKFFEFLFNFQEFVQKLFESKMTKLEVELYIEKVLNTKFFQSIDPEGPVIGKGYSGN